MKNLEETIRKMSISLTTSKKKKRVRLEYKETGSFFGSQRITYELCPHSLDPSKTRYKLSKQKLRYTAKIYD